jgi:DNA-binding MarR family transcriptional regulator
MNACDAWLRASAAARGRLPGAHRQPARRTRQTRARPGARPLHGFALQAIGPDGATVSELGRRLGVTRQAAAKTAAGLEQIGYITRQPSTRDARATVLTRTPRGQEMLDLSAAIFEQLRRGWGRRLGDDKVQAIEDGLAEIVTGGGTKIGDLPGWLR